MFGLSLGGQLIQGSAERTWNCISQITNLLWYKLNNRRLPIMPRQRRKHHSRSRSRSHSQDKERDVKRRRVEVFDSPNHKRSVSPEHGSSVEVKSSKILKETHLPEANKSEVIVIDSDSEQASPRKESQENVPSREKVIMPKKELFAESNTESDVENKCTNVDKNVDSKTSNDISNNTAEPTTPASKRVIKVSNDTTPRRITPKQMQKKLESEKKRLEREKERENRERQKQDEKDKKEVEKLKKKEEKQKEHELKQKEKEEKEEQKRLEKEQKRLEKEKKEEQKRKEREEEKLKKQQELDEKNREKQKEEEKKQKAAAAFVSFFVPKKVNNVEEKKSEDTDFAFMPFEVKSDMKLPLLRRKPLTQQEKDKLVKLLRINQHDVSYLKDLKYSTPRTCPKTWPTVESESDVIIIEDEEVFGETICEEKPKSERMRAKYLKFYENRRPAYYGTWRKKPNGLSGRRPFVKETIFDYEVDSDDEWEEEEQGENLEVMSDDDKENEPENDDYEVDNEFFVPHGHLSDDEVDDEETSRLSPESLKQKLKLLKDAFDEDIKSKTYKIKPRSIGCIWYDKDGNNVDAAIDRYLLPLAVITTGQITIKKRDCSSIDGGFYSKRKRISPLKDIPNNLMTVLLKLVHERTVKRTVLADEFLKYIQENNSGIELSKAAVFRHIANIADWTKHSKCKGKVWMVKKDVARKYGVELALPND